MDDEASTSCFASSALLVEDLERMDLVHEPERGNLRLVQLDLCGVPRAPGA
jgi:hypothetical protein